MKIKYAVHCPNCKRKHVLTLETSDISAWENGSLIQDVWPDLSASEREKIKTGFCNDSCWSQYLGEE